MQTDIANRIFRHTMSAREEPDAWVFDTIKAGTVAQKKNTTKRRKVSVVHAHSESGYGGTEDALRRLDLKDAPLQPSSPSPSTMKRSTVRKQPSIAQITSTVSKIVAPKRPLQPDMNFGNSGSTVRLFRRVSDNSTAGVLNEPLSVRDENHFPATEPVTKEDLLGRRAYSKAIDAAFQEVHAQTSSQPQREAISRLADAWSTLDATDPGGEFQLLKLIIEKVQADPKLASSIPSSRDETPQGTPQKPAQAPKLVISQNNPHLKSLRRKQSMQIAEEAARDKNHHLPGQVIPGMEHTKQLADVLYGRWTDGLKNRWPTT